LERAQTFDKFGAQGRDGDAAKAGGAGFDALQGSAQERDRAGGVAALAVVKSRGYLDESLEESLLRIF
jgi:hypothetical protein